MSNKILIILFVIVNLLSACKKITVIKEGSLTANIQIFNECGVPMVNKPVRIFGKKASMNSTTELVAEGLTDSLGNCTLNHVYYYGGTYSIKTMPSTISGALIKICEYRIKENSNYSIVGVNKGNGGIIPIKLLNYNSYTSNDTIYYQTLGNVGSTDPITDLALRYKVGPFNTAFIDTLTFSSCVNPSVISSSFTDILQIENNAIQNNVIASGVGYNDFIFRKSNDTSSAHIIKFKQVGCGFVDTLIFN